MARYKVHENPPQDKISPLPCKAKGQETVLPTCLYSASSVTVKLIADLFIFRMAGNGESLSRRLNPAK